MVSNSNNNTNFHINCYCRQFSWCRKAFANNSSANIEFLKTQLSKIVQLGGFLGKLLGPLLKIGLPLIKNIFKLLANDFLVQLRLTEAALTTDARILKEMLGFGSILIISNE